MSRNTTKNTKNTKSTTAKKPATSPKQPKTVKPEAKTEVPAPAPEQKKPVRATNKDNRTNGTYQLVRRNDNRVRITSGSKTIATVQVGTKKCSIHTATNDVFKNYLEKVVPYTMGPNSYKLSCKTEEIDTILAELFGECQGSNKGVDDKTIVPAKVEEATA